MTRYTAEVNNGIATVQIDTLSLGKPTTHNLNAHYLQNNQYKECNNTDPATVTINKNDVRIEPIKQTLTVGEAMRWKFRVINTTNHTTETTTIKAGITIDGRLIKNSQSRVIYFKVVDGVCDTNPLDDDYATFSSAIITEEWKTTPPKTKITLMAVDINSFESDLSVSDFIDIE